MVSWLSFSSPLAWRMGRQLSLRGVVVELVVGHCRLIPRGSCIDMQRFEARAFEVHGALHVACSGGEGLFPAFAVIPGVGGHARGPRGKEAEDATLLFGFHRGEVRPWVIGASACG
jgi:hypothetical protein